MKTKSAGAVLIAALALFFMSCGSNQQQKASDGSSNQSQSSQAAATPQAAQQTAQNTPAPAAAPASTPQRAPERATQPAPAPVKTYTVPAGTPVHIHLNDAISTATAQAGQAFSGTLSAPLVAGGVVVAPVGSAVSGSVVAAEKGGRLHHPATLSLTLTSLNPGGHGSIAIATQTWSQKAKSYTKRNAETIGGGAGVGALIGALAGHGKGAAIGAAVGAGAGTAGAAFTGKKDIVLPAEARLRFTLSRAVTVTRKSP